MAYADAHGEISVREIHPAERLVLPPAPFSADHSGPHCAPENADMILSREGLERWLASLE